MLVPLSLLGTLIFNLASPAVPIANTHPIEAYADVAAVSPGQTIHFYASLPNNSDGSQRTAYSVQYLRYGNSGATQPVLMLGPLAETNGASQAYTATSYVDGAGWSESFNLTVPTAWTSGIYAAELTDTAETSPELKNAYVTFMVHGAAGNLAHIALLTSTNTYQAYNFWPGSAGSDVSGSFYSDCNDQNARTQISFLRPDPAAMPINVSAECGPADPNVPYARVNWPYLENIRTEHLAAGDVRIARWLEKENYGYSVVTDWDLNQDWVVNQKLTLLDPATTPILIIGTHNEYWSQGMYNEVQAFMNRGGNVIDLGGNSLYWHVTMAIDPTTGNRTIQKTGNWSAAERQSLLGIGAYNGGLYPYCYSNLAQFSTNHWAYASVPLGLMGSGGEMITPAGDCAGNHAEAVGWETDYAAPRFSHGWAELGGLTSVPGVSDVFYFQKPSGGSVFVAGSITFGQSLIEDASNENILTPLLKNVISRMSVVTFSDFSAADPAHPESAGKPDLLVRLPGQDSLQVYRGLGNDTFEAGAVVSSSGWSGYDTILSAGDWNSDGAADVIARDTSGNLHLFLENKAGGFVAGTGGIINSGWGTNVFNALVAVGDWDGDGYPDLLARTLGGDLVLYRGNGHGGFISGGQVIKTGMNGLTFVGGADFDYNTTGNNIRTPGKTDLLARLDTTGELRLYHGNGFGFAGAYDTINQGWNGLNLMVAGDSNGDSNPDILACVVATGQMRVYHGTGGGAAYYSYLKNGFTSPSRRSRT